MGERRVPWWLWPNLLSLDAPIVAVSWLFIFAQTWRVNYLPIGAYWGLGAGVWAIYVTDRLIDARMHQGGGSRLGERHHFHSRHRPWFIVGILGAMTACGWVALAVLPVEFFGGYAVPAATLVAGFFAMVLVSSRGRDVPYFRNVVAGLAFGYGTAMMAHVYAPAEGAGQLLYSREMLCFGVLCALNISAIHLWEHSRNSDDPEVKAEDELALTLPLTLLAAFAVVFAYLDNPSMFRDSMSGHDPPARPFFYAILISAALLQVVNRIRSRFSLDFLRTLADLAMLVPLPLFVVLNRG